MMPVAAQPCNESFMKPVGIPDVGGFLLVFYLSTRLV
jgi:hypothetical protein